MDSAITIMLFEDEPLVAMIVQEALEEEGFQVSHCPNAQTAEQTIRESIANAAALVTDVRLGAGLTGWELARLAREPCPELPVVFISGDSAIEHNAQGVPGSIMIQKCGGAVDYRPG